MATSLDERSSTVPSTGALAAAALVVGSVVAVDPGGFAPFGPLRWLVVAVAGLVVIGATVRDRVVVERWSTAAWVVLLGWLALAAAAGVDPAHVWWGTPDRRLGWLTWVLFGALFVAGQQLRSDPELRLVARAASLAAILIGCWAALELVDRGPVDVELADGRIGGPYGQPAYVAAALVLLVPLAGAVAADRSAPAPLRVVTGSGALLGSVAVLASQTRAAWVAVLVAACVVAVVRRPRPGGRMLLVVAAIVVVVVLAVAPLRDRAITLTDPGAAGRLDEWRIAAATIADDPWIGAGPEGYRIAVTEHVDADYEREHGRSVLPDRAHDSVLDVAAVGGAPAALAFVVVLGMVVGASVRSVRRDSAYDLGLGAGVLAWVVQGVFLFPVVEVDPVAWLLAGVVVARQAGATWSLSVGSWVLAPVAAAIVVVGVTGVGELRADRDLAAAADALVEGDQRSALASADRATERRPDSIRAWFVASRTAAAGGTILDVDGALDRIEAGLAVSPLDPALRTERSRLLLDRAGRSGSAVDVDRAVGALGELVAADPNHAEHHLRLGVALALADRLDEAEAALRRAAELAPDAEAPLVDLARVAVLRGDTAAAQAALEELDDLAGSE
ncbi:MAG: O-antigen ligase family protein [Actinomycetota bacterium]